MEHMAPGDGLLVAGVFLAGTGFVSAVSAWSDRRRPRTALLVMLAGLALAGWGIARHPAPLPPAALPALLPEAVIRIIAEIRG